MKTAEECNCEKAIALIQETHKEHIQQGLNLKEKLQRNREKSEYGGSGERYWNSVIEVIENHYKHYKTP